jgi:hypothetical protein
MSSQSWKASWRSTSSINGRKGLYVRTDEFSARFEARLATENEIRSLLDRRKIIRDRRILDRPGAAQG